MRDPEEAVIKKQRGCRQEYFLHPSSSILRPSNYLHLEIAVLADVAHGPEYETHNHVGSVFLIYTTFLKRHNYNVVEQSSCEELQVGGGCE